MERHEEPVQDNQTYCMGCARPFAGGPGNPFCPECAARINQSQGQDDLNEPQKGELGVDTSGFNTV